MSHKARAKPASRDRGETGAVEKEKEAGRGESG
jgi:hypothetical protein